MGKEEVGGAKKKGNFMDFECCQLESWIFSPLVYDSANKLFRILEALGNAVHTFQADKRPAIYLSGRVLLWLISSNWT